ncbi:MAG: hypothetical protein ACT4PL_05415 [Phycisphaerales bacterium]
MKPLSARTIASELVIGAAVCGGAYFMLVDPVDTDLAATRAQIAAAQSAAEEQAAGSLSPQRATEIVKTAADFREVLTTRGEPARSQSVMFSAITAAAEAARTRVDELQPTTPNRRSAAGTPASKPLPGDAHTGYAMTVTAEYAALARFVRLLEREVGLSVVTSVRISPLAEPGSTKVHASITTEHWAFDLKPRPAVVAGAPQ